MKGSKSIHKFIAVFALAASAVTALSQVNTWTFKSHMIFARRDFAAVTGSDNRIYAIGGGSNGIGGAGLADCEVFDTTTDTWTAIKPMPFGRQNHAAVATPDGKIFVFGGACNVGGDNTSTLMYDIAGDSWSTCAAIPVGMDTPTAALGSDGKIIVIQGPTNLAPTATVRIYDPSNNTWSLPNVPNPSDLTLQPAALISPLGQSWFIDGMHLGQFERSVDIFDATADKWIVGPPSNGERQQACAAYGADDRIYLMGDNNEGTPSNTAEAYNPSRGVWDFIAHMNTARYAAGAATGPDGNVYIMGGQIGSNGINDATDSVECFTVPILSGSAVSFSAQEGTSVSPTVATFTDNTSDQPVDFTASIDWGDGTHTTGSVNANGFDSGNFTVTGTHTYAEAGSYPTSVTINDADGETTTVSGSATVTDAPLTGSAINVSAYSGVTFSGKVGTFNDANPSGPLLDYAANIIWGDGTNSAGTIAADPAGGFDVSGSHKYGATGSFSVTVYVSDVDGASVALNGLATVVEPPPVVSTGSLNLSEGVVFNGQVATFTDADPNLSSSSFTASINWGDGTSTTGNVGTGGSGFTVSGNHAYGEEGQFTVTVTVTVAGGGSGSSAGLANVGDAPLTATGYSLICKGLAFSDTVATFTDADPAGTASDFAALIIWGDGKSTPGTIVAGGSGWKVVGTHTYLKKAKYTVNVTIKDVGGANANATTLINVGPVK